MGKEYVILSFLKNKGIDYRYNIKKREIVIPCSQCGQELIMDNHTSDWYCEFCSNSGNLYSLIKSTSETLMNSKIYNPVKERKRIRNSLNNIIKNEHDFIRKERWISLIEQIDHLLDFYEKKRES